MRGAPACPWSVTADRSGAAVLLPEPRQLQAHGCLGHLCEVERRIQLGENRGLELVEGIGVDDWYKDDPQVGVHPRRQLHLVDGLLAVCLSQDRAEAAAKGREFV